MALQKSDRYMRNAAVVLGLAWMAIGCGPSSIAYIIGTFVPNTVDPVCKLANADKEITVVIASKFDSLEIRPDVQPMKDELAELLAIEMRKLFKENKDNVKIVPPIRVQPHLSKIKNWEAAELVPLGERFKADYVIALNIQNVASMLPNRLNECYDGKADIDVAVFDTHAPTLEAQVHKGMFRCNYPTTPITSSDCSPMQFRTRFTARMARDLSRWFAAHPPAKKVDMD